MIVERAGPTIGWQRGKEIDLRRNHAIGARDQVIIDLEVDEAEQDRDKSRKQGCQCGGPVKRVRAYELHLILRTLPPDYITAPDDAGVHDIGGIMGGEHSGVTEATTDILIECAYFDPDSIARTAG